MHVRGTVVDERDFIAIEIILQALHRDFISRNHRRRKHNRVTLREDNVLVLLSSNTHKSSKLFSLRSGCKHDNLVRRVVANFLSGNNRALFNLQEAGLLSDFKVGANGTSFHNDLLTELLSSLDDMNHAFKLRTERPDNQASLHGLHNLLKCFVDTAFRNGESILLSVR